MERVNVPSFAEPFYLVTSEEATDYVALAERALAWEPSAAQRRQCGGRISAMRTAAEQVVALFSESGGNRTSDIPQQGHGDITDELELAAFCARIEDQYPGSYLVPVGWARVMTTVRDQLNSFSWMGCGPDIGVGLAVIGGTALVVSLAIWFKQNRGSAAPKRRRR
jgi:hypothetical protein